MRPYYDLLYILYSYLPLMVNTDSHHNSRHNSVAQWRIQKSLVEGDVVEAGGVPPHHGEGAVPPPQKFFSILDLKMDSFGAL